MRDILTVIAAFVILILATALVVPPLMDWEAYRSFVDDAISRATGTEARTEGRIGVRLLPSPRIRLDRLRLGSKGPDAPSVTADFVWSEIALTPLLRGEVRFLETRIGRADIRVPCRGSWRISPDRLLGPGAHSTFAVEHLVVAQLLLDHGSGHRRHGSVLRRERDRGGQSSSDPGGPKARPGACRSGS